MVKLGQKVRDRVTGYEGIVVCLAYWLNGRIRATVQPPLNSSGLIPSFEGFDVEQLDILDKDSILIKKKSPTNGPMPVLQNIAALCPKLGM
jgi:hypothetical protein